MLTIVDNLWAVDALPRTPLGELTGLPPHPLARGRGLLSLPRSPTSLSAFGLDFRPFGPHSATIPTATSPKCLGVWVKHWMIPLHHSVNEDNCLLVQIWQCEFCGEPNVIDILADEIPTEPDVTYMISPAPATTAASCQGDENSMVIFCIDISGSMGSPVS